MCIDEKPTLLGILPVAVVAGFLTGISLLPLNLTGADTWRALPCLS